MGTPAPPALGDERIGKETACRDLPACLFPLPKHSAVSTQHSAVQRVESWLTG